MHATESDSYCFSMRCSHECMQLSSTLCCHFAQWHFLSNLYSHECFETSLLSSHKTMKTRRAAWRPPETNRGVSDLQGACRFWCRRWGEVCSSSERCGWHGVGRHPRMIICSILLLYRHKCRACTRPWLLSIQTEYSEHPTHKQTTRPARRVGSLVWGVGRFQIGYWLQNCTKG